MRTLTLQEGLQAGLADSRQNDGSRIGSGGPARSQNDLVSQVAAEGLQLVQQVVQFRVSAFLLLAPPISQRGTSLQAVVEQLAGFCQRVGKVGNCRIDDRVVGNVRQQV